MRNLNQSLCCNGLSFNVEPTLFSLLLTPALNLPHLTSSLPCLSILSSFFFLFKWIFSSHDKSKTQSSTKTEPAS